MEQETETTQTDATNANQPAAAEQGAVAPAAADKKAPEKPGVIHGAPQK